MTLQWLVFTLIFLSFSSVAADLTSDSDDRLTSIDRIEGNTVYFRSPSGTSNPKPLALNFSNIKPVGILRPISNTGQPYFLMSGRPCQDCKLEPVLFAFQPAGGKINRFVEPGKILDNKSRAVVTQSRAFYGRCLSSRKTDVLVVFQNEKVDRRRAMQSSVLIAEPVLDPMEDGKTWVSTLRETLLVRRLPRLKDTLHLVKSKKCKEIEGRFRVMASRPPEVNLKRQKTLDDDDDDAPPKENQADRDARSDTPQP